MAVSFEQYVAARWSRLVRSAVLLGADPHSAEDVVQTALAKTYFSWDKVTRAVDPDAYVHRVLINSLIDSRRRRWWGERPTETFPEVALNDEAAAVGDRDALRTALLALPLTQRQVVVLRYFADLTESQTATVLGVAAGTVKSRTSRALVALESDPTLRELIVGGER